MAGGNLPAAQAAAAATPSKPKPQPESSEDLEENEEADQEQDTDTLRFDQTDYSIEKTSIALDLSDLEEGD